jgi:hypothetical protein
LPKCADSSFIAHQNLQQQLLENGQQQLLERSNQRDATGGNKSSPDRAINCNLVPVEPKLSNGSLKYIGVFNASSCKNTFPK